MIWFDPKRIRQAAPSGRRGRQQPYSDAAAQTCLPMKVLFGMALRQTTGFVACRGFTRREFHRMMISHREPSRKLTATAAVPCDRHSGGLGRLSGLSHP